MAGSIKALNPFQIAFITQCFGKSRVIMQASAGAGKSLAGAAYYAALKKRLSSSDRQFGRFLMISKTKSINVFDSALSALKLSSVKLVDQSDLAVFSSTYDYPSDCYLISTPLMSKLMLEGTQRQKQGFYRLLSMTGVMLLDECHGYRNYSAKQTQAMVRIADYYNQLINADPLYHRIIGMSATPVFKDLTNWFAMFRIIDPALFGVSYKAFEQTYCITEERTLNGYGKAWSRNGSYATRKAASFTQILGFKNTENLMSKIQPYLFTYHSEGFNFSYKLHYYSLTQQEISDYNTIIDGTGLEKAAAITLQSGSDSIVLYRDMSDVFYQDSDCKVPITVKDLCAEMSVYYDNRFYKVAQLLENRKTANYSIRCVKAIQAEGLVQDRLDKIANLIRSYGTDSITINFSYHNTIDGTEDYLHSQFPGRRIVKLTGKTPDFQSVFRSINWDHDFILISKAAGESLSMYSKHVIISEMPTNPGSIEQLIGRLSRHDSPHRDFTVDILLNDKSSITAYFYERLKLLLSSSDINTFANFSALPNSKFLTDIERQRLDLQHLKSKLLWRKVRLS